MYHDKIFRCLIISKEFEFRIFTFFNSKQHKPHPTKPGNCCLK